MAPERAAGAERRSPRRAIRTLSPQPVADADLSPLDPIPLGPTAGFGLRCLGFSGSLSIGEPRGSVLSALEPSMPTLPWTVCRYRPHGDYSLHVLTSTLPLRSYRN